MPKLQEANDRFFVTVPKDVVKLKGWNKGDVLEFHEICGYVCVIEANPGSRGQIRYI